MGCTRPLDGWYSQVVNPSGKRSVVFDLRTGLVDRPVRLPCGKCPSCLLVRKREWMTRIVHESQLWEDSWFVTVTYDDEHLPVGGMLCRKDVQDFVKRLRKRLGYEVRVFYCGEYGDRYGRPHYHMILFGAGFEDREFVSKRGEFPVYRSEVLAEEWGMGRTELGLVSPSSAAYVSGYLVGQVHGDIGAETFVGMSLKPGIGFWWFMRYWSEVYPVDRVVIDGVEYAPPRVYDRWLSVLRPELWREVRAAREARRVEEHPDDRSSRGLVIEECQRARLSLYEREVGYA